MADLSGNISDLKTLIAQTLKDVKALKLDRADINEDIGARRAKLAARGIPKKAFDMAASYLDMDPEDREGFDIAYALVREAGGLPMQDDLFTLAERKGKEAVDPENPPAVKEGQTGQPDPAAMAKVIQSQEDEKMKGKKVLPSSTGSGTIN